MPLSEVAAVRRMGALVTLAAASALMSVLFPAAAAADGSHAVIMSALLSVFQLGCAAVLLSSAYRAIDQLARLAAPAREQLRRVGFTGIVLYAAYVLGKVRKELPAAAAKEMSVDVVHGSFLFLVFLAELWTVYLSQPVPAGEQELDGGEFHSNSISPSAPAHDSEV